MSTIVQFVRTYNREQGRGCPKGVLLHVGNFKAKEIESAVDAGLLEASRGKEGGFFPMGERPAPKSSGESTLKARMVEALRVHADGDQLDREFAAALVAEYDAEIEKRRQAQA
jgi:hypothetical protein